MPSFAAASSAGGLDHVASGARIFWDRRPWTILTSGQTTIYMRGLDGTLIDLPLKDFEAYVKRGEIFGLSGPPELDEVAREHNRILVEAGPDEIRVANERHRIVILKLQGGDVTDADYSERTIRRWCKAYQEARELSGYGYVGLFPNWKNCGNRTDRQTEQVLDLIYEVIKDSYLTSTQKNKRQVFGELETKCEALGLDTPSYKTFCKIINGLSKVETARKRTGPRSAYSIEKRYLQLEYKTPRHGSYPFQIVHADHTEVNLELVHSKLRINLGRAWVSFLVDAYSRRILVVYVSFDPPSYRTLMMLLRELVRRYSRLPNVFVVDHGKEFSSIYFEMLLAHYSVEKWTRPPSKGRFGNVIERLFNTSQTEFIHNLSGNTQIMTKVRQMTKSFNPKGLAEWTLGGLYVAFQEWAYEVYDTAPHSTLGVSPREMFQLGQQSEGERDFKLIQYKRPTFEEGTSTNDDNDTDKPSPMLDFYYLSLPTTRKGESIVQPGEGVTANYLNYSSTYTDLPEVIGKPVPIRIDPDDVSHVYAFILGAWRECYSGYYMVFRGRSEREIQIASAELRKQQRLHSQSFDIRAATLANFILSLEGQKCLQTQQYHDYERLPIHSEINLSLSDAGGPELQLPAGAVEESDPVEETSGSSVEPQYRTLESF